jgi:hypothetical protein
LPARPRDDTRRRSPAILQDQAVPLCWSSSPDRKTARLDAAARQLGPRLAQLLHESARRRRVALRIARKIWLRMDFRNRTFDIGARRGLRTECRTSRPGDFRLSNPGSASTYRVDQATRPFLYHPVLGRGSRLRKDDRPTSHRLIDK